MDHIVTLDSRQEVALQAIADKFIALHKGDAVKALKEMIVLNGHLQERLDAGGGSAPGERLEGCRSTFTEQK
ncbi:hypothetical protein NKI56_28400 [Mesorhizobium sp. M0622]|uniref:hypothetical protein n=1 Tax=unclassified Mesorhizobium TaxID=325217 RepID=UPI003334C0AA